MSGDERYWSAFPRWAVEWGSWNETLWERLYVPRVCDDYVVEWGMLLAEAGKPYAENHLMLLPKSTCCRAVEERYEKFRPRMSRRQRTHVIGQGMSGS